MRGLVYFILLWAPLVCRSAPVPKYPDCLKSIGNLSNLTYGSEKFMQEYSGQFPSMLPYSFTEVKSTLVWNQFESTFIVLLVVVACLMFFLITFRILTSYSQIMKLFVCMNSTSCVNWAIISVSLFSIILLSSAIAGVQDVLQFAHHAECSAMHLKNLLLYGDNASDWAGFSGFERLLQMNTQYLAIISDIPTEYSSTTVSLTSRIGSLSRFSSEFEKGYQGAEIRYSDPALGEQTLSFKKLLPQLYDPDDYSWFDSVEKLNNKFIEISRLAVEIEQLLDQIKVGGRAAADSLQKKLGEFSMPKRLLEKTEDITAKWAGYKENSRDVLLLIRIFFALGIQSCFAYGILVAMSWRIKHALLLKMVNFVWIVLIGESLICIVMFYVFTGLETTLNAQCLTYTSLLSNSSDYFEYANLTTPKPVWTWSRQVVVGKSPPTYYNLHEQLYPCIFGDGQFTNFADFRNDTRSLTKFMSDLRTYVNLMDPTSEACLNLYAQHELYRQIIKEVDKRKYGNSGSYAWAYLNTKLDTLNDYTLRDALHEKCYRHAWVLRISECPLNSYIRDSRKPNNLLKSSTEFDWAKPQCMVLVNEDQVGELNLLSYDKFIHHYVMNTNESRCTGTISMIMEVSLDLIGALQAKQESVRSLIHKLSSQQQALQEHLRIIRMNYRVKKHLYEYILSNESRTPISPESLRNYTYATKSQSNCSCVKRWVMALHGSVCLGMRARVMQSYYYMMTVEICLALLILFGFMHGANQELEQIQDIYYDKIEASDSGDSDYSFKYDRRKLPQKWPDANKQK